MRTMFPRAFIWMVVQVPVRLHGRRVHTPTIRTGAGTAGRAESPGVQRVELYVGDATRAVPPSRVRDIVTALTAS
jgi:hypothetical protein